MKALIVFAFAAMTTVAFASPNVGDSATYTASASGMDFSMTMKLTAFNAATNTFTKETLTSMMGQEQVESEEVATDELATDEALSMVMALCETDMINGKLASVTVAAGTFDTCEIVDAQSGAIQNIGLVPFGLVKFQSAEVSLELSAFAVAL